VSNLIKFEVILFLGGIFFRVYISWVYFFGGYMYIPEVKFSREYISGVQGVYFFRLTIKVPAFWC